VLGQEHRAHEALDGDRCGLEVPGQVPAPTRQHGPEAHQGKVPKQHRALVAPPGGGDTVEHRLLGVGIGRNVRHREVGGDEGVDEGGEGQASAEAGQGGPLASAGQEGGAPEASRPPKGPSGPGPGPGPG
jgi:hypothetical protein